MQPFSSVTTFVSWIMLSALMAGCGGDAGPSGPAPTGTLSGTVRDAVSQSAIANASVKVGTATTQTTASGQFQLQNVAVGSVSVSVDAPGFDGYAATIAIQAGTNSHDVSLSRATVYAAGDIVAYLPPAVSTYRGVLFILGGAAGDSRAFVRGQAGCWDFAAGPCDVANNADFRQRLLILAERYGLALFGARTSSLQDGPAGYDAMLGALVSVAQQSGRSELASAPLLLIGSSRGGCIAHGFTRVHPERVIGFMSAKGSCHVGGPSPASRVPGYLFIGSEDRISPNAIVTITELFLANRVENALWAIALEPGTDHGWLAANALTLPWMDAVLARRLAETGPAGGSGLRSIDESSGWLGDRSTTAIAVHGCYAANKLLASWLPSEQTARDWQTLVGGNGAVISC